MDGGLFDGSGGARDSGRRQSEEFTNFECDKMHRRYRGIRGSLNPIDSWKRGKIYLVHH